MEHLRIVNNNIEERKLRTEGIEIVFFNTDSQQSGYIVPTNASIKAVFNVTKTGQTQILSYRTSTTHFDLTQLEYIEVDGTILNNVDYYYTFTTKGLHDVVYKFKDNLESINLTSMFDNGSGTIPYLYECDLTNMQGLYVVSVYTMFQFCYNLHKIIGNSYLSWDTISQMRSTYNSCYSLEDPIQFPSPNRMKSLGEVTSMARTFQMVKYPIVNMGYFDTSKVTDFTATFRSGTTTELHVSNWNTSACTNMEEMFSKCHNLLTVGNLSGWDVSNVQNMKWIFRQCRSLTSIDGLDNWNTSACTNMNGMFEDCLNLSAITDLSLWNVSHVTDMTDMFLRASKLKSIGDLSNWNTSACTKMAFMFGSASGLTSIGNLNNWDVSHVTNMADMFAVTQGLTNIGDLSTWNTSACTNMQETFAISNISNLDLTHWDVSRVTTMDGMFMDATNLRSVGDLSNWNTSACTKLCWMFRDCNKLTTVGDLSNWDVSNNTDFSHFLHKCSNISDIGNISGWSVTNCTGFQLTFSMTNISYMGDLKNWDMSNVVDLSGMFHMASKLTTLGDISNWDVRKMEGCEKMFEQCQSLTELNLSGWTTNSMTQCGGFIVNSKKLAYLNLYNWTTSACTASKMDIFEGPYNDSLTTIVLGPNFFTHPTANYSFFSNARHWSHDSVVESLITNQQTRNTSLVKTVTLFSSVYNTLTQSELDAMANLGLNIISS